MERWVVIHSIGQGGRPPQGGSPRWRALLCTSWHVARSQLGRSSIFGGRVYCSSTLGTLFLGLLSVDTFPLQDLTEVPTPTSLLSVSAVRRPPTLTNPTRLHTQDPYPASQQLVPRQCCTLVIAHAFRGQLAVLCRSSFTRGDPAR